MKMLKSKAQGIAIMLILCCFGQLFGQAPAENKFFQPRFYAFWGWNRGTYAKSDIHFEGENHDFVLSGVKAKDRPTKFALDPYFHPERITIPQTNVRIGYFISPKYSLSFGIDHMKYVMNRGQTVLISGQISETSTSYDGNYDNDEIVATSDFLQFEHTDGLNYGNIELRRHFPIWSWHKSKYFSVDIEAFSGLGAGLMVPRSDVRMFGTDRNDEYHLAGYAGHAVTGLGFRFWKYFAIWPEFKGGIIKMPNIRTSTNPLDLASQHIWYGEFDVLIGGTFSIGKKQSKLNFRKGD